MHRHFNHSFPPLLAFALTEPTFGKKAVGGLMGVWICLYTHPRPLPCGVELLYYSTGEGTKGRSH